MKAVKIAALEIQVRIQTWDNSDKTELVVPDGLRHSERADGTQECIQILELVFRVQNRDP